MQLILYTLKQSKLIWNKSLYIGGEYELYIQRVRVIKDINRSFAKLFVDKGYAYYYFCKNAQIDFERYFFLFFSSNSFILLFNSLIFNISFISFFISFRISFLLLSKFSKSSI